MNNKPSTHPHDDPVAGLEVYLVGGAVRDELLGRPIGDRDYVVVGSTPDALLARGFTRVGRDFPVFLHPHTQEEHALARTERKSAPGYHGFTVHADPDITLEQDLARRDLTINALARAADGTLIDPYGGRSDLEQRWLRHLSPAFAEDPVRILRLARFAARYADLGFRIAPETEALMRTMVEAGEVDALVPDRVWREMARALLEPRPSVFFETLRRCGALARLWPELDRLWGVPQPSQWHPEIDTGAHGMMALDMVAQLSPVLEVRFAALCHDLGKGETPEERLPAHHGHEARGVKLINMLRTRMPVPTTCIELARLSAKHHGNLHRVAELRPGTIVDLFAAVDLFRRPERFEQLLLVCEADARGRLHHHDRPYPQGDQWRALAAAVRAVDTAAIARTISDHRRMPEQIRQARIKAIRQHRR